MNHLPASKALLLLPLLLATTACGFATDRGEDGGTDGGDPVTLCADLIAPLTTIALDPEGAPTQIHVAATFASEQIWVTYSIPVPGGNFSIQGLRVACDGSLVGAPFVVSDDVAVNQLDSVVAGSGDRVMIAWQADNQGSPYNLDTFHRVYGPDGTALTGPTELAALRQGVVNVHNAWMPAVAGRAGGGFTLVGAWGHADATAFQAYGQHLDAEGALVGESWDWSLLPTLGQVFPTVSLDQSGAVFAAWQEDTAGDPQIVQGTLASGATTPGAAVAVAGSGGGQGPSLSSFGSETWLAFSTPAGLQIRLPDGTFGSAGLPGDFGASVAAHEGGAMIAWYHPVAGYTAEVHYAWISSAGLVSGAGSAQTTTAISAYALTLTSLGDGRFFLAWQEGQNPDFFLRGRFLSP